jgi:hypothetical protein
MRRVRLRLKFSQLVIDRLGVGGEAKKFCVTLLVVHADNLTARDNRGKGVRSTMAVGVINRRRARHVRHPALDPGVPERPSCATDWVLGKSTRDVGLWADVR